MMNFRSISLPLLSTVLLIMTGKEPAMAMKITSTAFADGGPIPIRHTCRGEDLSPPLTWADLPHGTVSLVLIVDDPDAPDPRAPKMTWVHWVLYNLPPTSIGLPEAVATLPPGTGEGLNDWQRTGYGGPCPPIGRHRYFFKLYALDTMLDLPPHPLKRDVEKVMAGHVLGETILMGTFQK